MNTDQTVLTDNMWERIEPLLSGKATGPGRTADNRLFLKAVLWRFRRWVQKGLFERMFSILSDNVSAVSVDETIMQAHAKAFGFEKGDHTKTAA
ncbi:MAG: hypothetical protein OXC62_06795 [Aestuariivita sp.]|nr:hypothetical protein [Aestuariivita sp.]